MGNFILWFFLTTPYVIMFLYFGFLFDFLDKYNHKRVIKALPFNIRYYYLIHFNKSMEYNLFDLEHKSKKKKSGNVSARSFYFQMSNYIYLLFSFNIMLIRCIFINVDVFKVIYQITLIINLVLFVVYSIMFIFYKKSIKNKSIEC